MNVACFTRLRLVALGLVTTAVWGCVGPEPSSRLATEVLLPVRADGTTPPMSAAAIAERRAHAQQTYLAQTKACQQRFAYHDCERAARRERNQVLEELRMQERALRDAQLLDRQAR